MTMNSVFILLLIFSSVFSAFILLCYFYWNKLPKIAIQNSFHDKRMSVIVTARNEEKNIQSCLASLQNQDMPPTQIDFIIIDDHSTDETANIIRDFMALNPQMKIIFKSLEKNAGGSKKDAIAHAVSISNTELLLVTDADCVGNPSWIRTMHSFFINKKALLLAGPVCIDTGSSIFGMSQSLEFMGLVGISAAGISAKHPIMCNGANLMFTRTIFYELDGFNANKKLASGDDTQLLLKVFSHDPDRVFFIKDEAAIVHTKSVNRPREFVQQRKRWAGKIPFALTSMTIGIAFIAWMTHALLLLSLVLALLNGALPPIFILSVFLVFLSEFILLNSLSDFFNKRSVLWLFLPLQPAYWIYIVLIGIIAPFGTFRWKDRISK